MSVNPEHLPLMEALTGSVLAKGLIRVAAIVTAVIGMTPGDPGSMGTTGLWAGVGASLVQLRGPRMEMAGSSQRHRMLSVSQQN